MHGVVFQELQRFVKEEFGFSAWHELKESAGVDTSVYMATNEYPDREAVALVRAAAEMTGTSGQEVLAQFGEFIGPNLVEMYGSKVREEWDALDLIENTERTIHEIVRADEPEADPPKLEAERIDDGTVEVTYRSEREMCGLARGIARGVGNHYDQALSVAEPTCMLDGHEHCTLRISAEQDHGGAAEPEAAPH